MTNYEKLCEAAGIEKELKYYACPLGINQLPLCPFPNWKQESCSDCSKSNKMKPVCRFPDFAAEKQVELIKLIADCKNITPLRIKTDKSGDIHIYCYNTPNIMDKDRTIYTKINADFQEALAGLALQLIEAGELDKDEVRKILE